MHYMPSLLSLLLLSCSLEPLGDLGPTDWKAFFGCDDASTPMPADEPIEVAPGWTCTARHRSGGEILCESGGQSIRLSADCENRGGHAYLALDRDAVCVVELTCKGGPQ